MSCPYCKASTCSSYVQKTAEGKKLVLWECQIGWKPHPGQQTKFFQSDAFEVLYGGAAGGGKGLLPTANILTTSGWKQLKDLKLYEQIYNPNGSVQEVTGIFPQGLKYCFTVFFEDGSSIITSDDHLWRITLSDSSNRSHKETNPTNYFCYLNNFERIMQTKDIYKRYATNKGRKKDFQKNYYIPLANTIPGYIDEDNGNYFNKKKLFLQTGYFPLGKKIVDVCYEGKLECICIKVSNPNGLFITDHFIVTHNSDALLVEGLRQVNHPDYWAIMFRRKTPDLWWLIERSKQLFPKLVAGSVYNQSRHCWTFPSGAKYFFAHLENEEDKESHSGKPYQYIAFDELTFFTETQYTYLISRCRSASPGLRTYVRSSAMPLGAGIAWVKERFITPVKPETIWRPDKESQLTRQFIPARFEDNLTLAKHDPEYPNKLKNLGHKLFYALRFGDWDKIEGSAFDELDIKIHLRPQHKPPPGALIFRAMDWGYEKPFCVLWFYEAEDGSLVAFRELYGNKVGELNKGIRSDPRDVARRIKEYESDLVISFGVADPACWGSGKQNDSPSIAEAMRDEGVVFYQAINDRVQGRMELHARLSKENGGPFLQITENCSHVWRTLPLIAINPTKPEDVLSTGEDHAYDALRYGVMARKMRFSNSFIVDYGRDTVMSTQEEALSAVSASGKERSEPSGSDDFPLQSYGEGLNYDEELFI